MVVVKYKGRGNMVFQCQFIGSWYEVNFEFKKETHAQPTLLSGTGNGRERATVA